MLLAIVRGFVDPSAARRAFETESDATNRKSDRSFLLLRQICFESIVNRSQVMCVVLFVQNDGFSIFAAGGHAEAEVTSPFDGSIMVPS
jgi:hypothetical protein